MIATRTSDIFATSAKQNGKVISLKKEGIIVEYEDGSQVGVELGRRYGGAASLTYPFTVKTRLRLGDTVVPGDCIAYNEEFFAPDFLNRKGVVWKNAAPIMTAVLEAPDTYEDSSSIYKGAAEKLMTRITEKRVIILNFDEAVHDVVEVGKKVRADDHLCIIEDSVTTSAGLLDQSSIDTLRLLSSQSPRARVEGVVERIEVIYNGDLADMSDSLRALAERSDKQRASRLRASNKPIITGRANDNYKVGGQTILQNTLAIEIYITVNVPYGNGDKAVFGNQLKTVNGDVLDSPMITESGVEVHSKFGSKAIGDRVVHSPDIIGTTSRLMVQVGVRALRAYRNQPV